MNLYEVLRRPLVTEKSTRLSEAGTYVFEVDKKSFQGPGQAGSRESF